MVSIIGRIRRTVARTVPVTPAYAEARPAPPPAARCCSRAQAGPWRQGARADVGAAPAGGGRAAAQLAVLVAGSGAAQGGRRGGGGSGRR